MCKLGANIFLISTTSNYNTVISSLQKSAFSKLTILLQKLRSVAQIEWKKHQFFFFYFWFKNKQVWAEKIGKN
jgi:hypothetical protein